MSAVPDDFSARLRRLELDSQANANRIRSHEEICAERYANINDNIRGMRSILVKAAGLLIAGMAGILVKLVFFGGA
jgi:hypothetical protein